MAVGGVEVLDLGFVATEALTEYRFVQGEFTDGRGVKTVANAGEQVLGVAMHSVESKFFISGSPDPHVNVRLMGIATVEAGGVVPAGSMVATDADGKAVVAQGGDFAAGMALDGASGAGELISVFLLAPAAQAVVTSP